jgi:type I restriction enzyme M protein
MALKKSDLYSSLWASCDELRGGMDASQYKDYVLFMLFIKHITDKYGNSTDFAPPVTIPKGASFKDMLALRGKSDIGDKINMEVIAPLVQANTRLARSDFPDFNNSNKLGEGQAKVERLTNLVNIFANPQLDFSQNRADHDDILGDTYTADSLKHSLSASIDPNVAILLVIDNLARLFPAKEELDKLATLVIATARTGRIIEQQ